MSVQHTPDGAILSRGEDLLKAARVVAEIARGGEELHAVGATMLLIRADIHRDGLIFPPCLYGAEHPLARHPHPFFGERRGELESEGLITSTPGTVPIRADFLPPRSTAGARTQVSRAAARSARAGC